jgi:glutathione synthase/RimK-type ligase-like ATP-grasp enzyme
MESAAPHPHSTPRIALATCAYHPGFCANDDAPLVAAFRARAVDAPLVRWDDPAVHWADFDAVLIRTTWDYPDRLAEFCRWVERVSHATRLFNPPAVVTHNLDKRYLRALERAGVPTVPTTWLESGGASHDGALRSALADLCQAHAPASGALADLILKPAIGAGASGLDRFAPDDLHAAAAHARILLTRGPALAQAFLPSILDRGELSIVLLDGEVSHAVRKVPKPGDFRVQIEFGGVYTVVEPTAHEIDIAQRAHAALAGAHAPLLYARCDLVEPAPGLPAVIEFEAVEPELFFPLVPGAAARLADLTLARLGA